MRTSKYTFVLSFILVNFLAACQNDRQQSLPESGVNNRDPITMGPNDSGGGDSCNGKLIESYRINLNDLPEYQRHIVPIFKNLSDKSSSPEEELNLKNWYLVDCALSKLPESTKGLYLDTQQVAIHTKNEVYIDANLYKKMEEVEKAKLLLHEIVMSVYLMKYMSLNDICLKSRSCSSDIASFGKWKMFAPQKYRPLNAEDHEKIRSVTSWIWAHRGNLQKEEFYQQLLAHDFDSRFFDNVEDFKPYEVSIKRSDFFKILSRHKWGNLYPTNCAFTIQSESSSSCDIDIVADVKEVALDSGLKFPFLNFKTEIVRSSDRKTFSFDFWLPEKAEIKIIVSNFKPFKNAGFFSANSLSSTKGLKVGDSFQNLFILFSFKNIKQPDVLWMKIQSYKVYAIEEDTVEIEKQKFKQRYAYLVEEKENSEEVFIESEMPLKFDFSNFDKIFISQEEI